MYYRYINNVDAIKTENIKYLPDSMAVDTP